MIVTSAAMMLRALAIVAAVCAGAATPSLAASAVRLTLDRPIDGAAAPVVVAGARGLFAAEGLAVTLDIANGAQDALARVADGSSDATLTDINALIRFRDRDDAPALKAVFIVFNRVPYALIARKSRGITNLSDLSGRTLGAAESDLSLRFWPALARANGVAPDTVKRETIAAIVREPMLSAGQIDAVTGYSFLAALNIRDRGVPADDLTVLRFAALGCPAYGHALIVSPALIRDRPEQVRALVRAMAGGVKLAVSDPAGAVGAVLARMDNGARAIETERLAIAIRDLLVTDETRRNGLGGIEPQRFEAAAAQMAATGLRRTPKLDDIFDGAFLPASSQRMVN